MTERRFTPAFQPPDPDPRPTAGLMAGAFAEASPVDPKLPVRLVSSPSLNRQTVILHTAHYAGATYGSRALAAIRSFINARWLGPELYGFCGTLAFINSFAYHLHAGVQDMLVKEIPTQRSHGRQDQAARLTQIGWTFLLGMLLIASAGLGLRGWLSSSSTPAVFRWGWWIAALALPLEVLSTFERAIARAEERFVDISRALWASTLASVGLTAWLVIRYGVVGFYAVAILTPVCTLWLLHRHASYRWRPTWSWPELRPLLRAGWPAVAMTMVFDVIGWIDRGLVLSFLGVSAFGYYALATMLMQCGFVLPEVFASVVEPRLYAHYASAGRLDHVREHVWFPLHTLAWLMPLGVGVVNWVLPPLVRRWLPAYTPGLGAMRVLIWGSCFMGLIVCTKSLIITLGLQRRVLWFYGIAIAVHLATGLTCALRGWGLVGIAGATVLAYAVCCTQLLYFAARCFGYSGPAALLHTAGLYVPIALVWGSTVALPWAARKMPASSWPVPVAGIKGIALAILVLIAWRQLTRRAMKGVAAVSVSQPVLAPSAVAASSEGL